MTTTTRTETKLDRANAIVSFCHSEGVASAKVWTGGDKVRVYYGQGKSGGYLEVSQYQCDLRALNHHSLSSALREAGLTGELKTIEAVPAQQVQPEWQKKGYLSQIDFEMEDPNGLYYG